MSFATVQPVSTALLGVFWDGWCKEDFPRLEERPPYDPPVERFDGFPVGPSFSVDVGGVPSPRLWLLSADGDELLQLQPDWFACNWRKVAPDAEYGRWDSRRTTFSTWLGRLLEFLGRSGTSIERFNQVEVTYVNHMAAGEGWERHGELDRILRLVDLTSGGTPSVGEPERVQLDVKWAIRDSEGEPVGRLHLGAQPALRREDKQPAIALTLTARGAPLGEGLAGVQAFAELGHEQIVRTFDEVTTDEMHARWSKHG